MAEITATAEIVAPNKYNNSKIYKICSNLSDKIYIGSTTKTLSQRLKIHIKDYKHYLKTNTKYLTSIEIIKLGDFSIVLIEECNFNTQQQLFRREGEIIKLNIHNVVNMLIAGRTKEEYVVDNKEHVVEYRKKFYNDNKEQSKQYKIDNKEKLVEQRKQYYNDNKEQITELKKQYFNDNKEHIVEQRKQYYNDNKEQLKQYYNDNKEHKIEQSKQYYNDNKEQIKERMKQYNNDNKEKIAEQKKQRYLKLKALTI